MASFDFSLQPTDFSGPVRRAQEEELMLRQRRNALAAFEQNQARQQQFQNALRTGGVDAAAQVDPEAAQPYVQQRDARNQRALQGVATRAWSIYTAPSPRMAAQQMGSLQSFAEDLGKPFDQISDDDIRELARADAYKAIAAGGLDPKGFQEPKPNTEKIGTLYQVDESGRPVYRSAAEAAGKPAYRAPKGGGFNMQMPDGTVISLGGEGGQPFSLPKPAINQVGGDYVDANAGLQRLQGIVASYDPQFSTLEGRFKGGWASVRAMAPSVFGQLPAQDREYLQRYTTWRSNTLDNLNRYIKEITGAAMTIPEAERIMQTIPSVQDDPVVFQSKTLATMKRLSLVAARSNYLLANPTLSMNNITLDRMQSVIESRANELYAGYLRGGVAEAEARQKAMMEARQQFGLGNGQ